MAKDEKQSGPEGKGNERCISACLVLGLGHTGCRVLEALDGMSAYRDIELVAFDTDSAELKRLSISRRLRTVLLGESVVMGHGTGGDMCTGAFILSQETARYTELLCGRRLLIVVAGLGGGTGSAAEHIFKVANTAGVPCVLLAVMPFSFECERRIKLAEDAIGQMERLCHVVVLAPNDRLLAMHKDEPVEAAYAAASAYLAKAAAEITTPFASNALLNGNPGILNTLIGNYTSRCHFIHAEGRMPDPLGTLVAELETQPDFPAERLLRNTGNAAALLRCDGTCREDDIYLLMDIIKKKMPDASVECAVCFDPGLPVCMSLTLLVQADVPAVAPSSAQRERGGGSRRADHSGRQLNIPFPEDGLGIFSGDPANIWKGVNLDIPTFRRRNILIDKGF